MDIIRSSTRANKKSTTKPEISDWYKDKIIPYTSDSDLLPHIYDMVVKDGRDYYKTHWGYVRADLINNNDTLRGLVPLSIACDNISQMSFRDWRHVYHLRRKGTHAAPELQDAVEQVREELYKKCWWLGEYLGKIWTEDGFAEKNDIIIRRKSDLEENL